MAKEVGMVLLAVLVLSATVCAFREGVGGLFSIKKQTFSPENFADGPTAKSGSERDEVVAEFEQILDGSECERFLDGDGSTTTITPILRENEKFHSKTFPSSRQKTDDHAESKKHVNQGSGIKGSAGNKNKRKNKSSSIIYTLEPVSHFPTQKPPSTIKYSLSSRKIQNPKNFAKSQTSFSSAEKSSDLGRQNIFNRDWSQHTIKPSSSVTFTKKIRPSSVTRSFNSSNYFQKSGSLAKNKPIAPSLRKQNACNEKNTPLYITTESCSSSRKPQCSTTELCRTEKEWTTGITYSTEKPPCETTMEEEACEPTTMTVREDLCGASAISQEEPCVTTEEACEPTTMTVREDLCETSVILQEEPCVTTEEACEPTTMTVREDLCETSVILQEEPCVTTEEACEPTTMTVAEDLCGTTVTSKKEPCGITENSCVTQEEPCGKTESEFESTKPCSVTNNDYDEDYYNGILVK